MIVQAIACLPSGAATGITAYSVTRVLPVREIKGGEVVVVAKKKAAKKVAKKKVAKKSKK